MLSRRSLILGGVSALGGSLLPAHAHASVRGDLDPGRKRRLDLLASAINPELRMFNANTNERMSGKFYGPDGYDHVVLHRINWFMRDWRQREMVQMDVRIIWAMAAIRQAAMRDGHDGVIRFLSGYRSKATNELLRRRGINAARDSLHITGRAGDLSLPGVPVRQVFEYAKWLEIGGVGHYPGSFVHIDSGRLRNWG